MSNQSDGSVSHWLEGLRNGDSVAAQELWNRYFSQLVQVAQARLCNISRESSGEDIALSAIKSVMIGVQNDRYPQLTDRTNLWSLLVTITARKAISEIRRQKAARRDVSMEIPTDAVKNYIGTVPTAEFAIEVAYELERLIHQCKDDSLMLIAQRKLEGATHAEVAEELGCSSKTIVRKLNRIRREWEESQYDSFETAPE